MIRILLVSIMDILQFTPIRVEGYAYDGTKDIGAIFAKNPDDLLSEIIMTGSCTKLEYYPDAEQNTDLVTYMCISSAITKGEVKIRWLMNNQFIAVEADPKVYDYVVFDNLSKSKMYSVSINNNEFMCVEPGCNFTTKVEGVNIVL